VISSRLPEVDKEDLGMLAAKLALGKGYYLMKYQSASWVARFRGIKHYVFRSSTAAARLSTDLCSAMAAVLFSKPLQGMHDQP